MVDCVSADTVSLAYGIVGCFWEALLEPVSYTHLTLPTNTGACGSGGWAGQ